jgi:hypothetical protein
MRHIREYEEHAKTQMLLDEEFKQALFGHPDMERAKSLLRQGANVDVTLNSGDTPLHLAAEYSPSMVAFLCDNGADIEALSSEGKTPLQHAKKLWPPCAKILIERGADPSSAFDSIDELEDFFEGDISWIPEESIPPEWEWRKRQRARGAFGRF